MDTQNYKLPKIFPVLPADKYKELKIDEDSYKYITSKEVANLITKICCKHLCLFHIYYLLIRPWLLFVSLVHF